MQQNVGSKEDLISKNIPSDINAILGLLASGHT